MTFQEISKLLDAGFTHDEIMGFTDNPEPAKHSAASEPEKAAEPETPDPTQEDDKKPSVSSPEPLPDVDKLTNSIDQLIKTIQASNLAHASFDNKSQTIDQEVDQIMSTLIRPERKDTK